MKIPSLGFSLVEKFAIVQAVDTVIVAEGTFRQSEIEALAKLMRRIDFETNFILQARNMSIEKSHSILQKMPYEKKKALVKILEEIALPDSFVHTNETSLINKIFSHIGIEEESKAAR